MHQINKQMRNTHKYDFIVENVNSDLFITQFNSRLFENLKEVLKNVVEFNISYLSDLYEAKELGRIIEIQNRISSIDNCETVVHDCINVINDEKDKLGVAKSTDMDDDDFRQAFEKLGKTRKDK